YERVGALVDLWVAARGPAFALRALVRSGALERAPGSGTGVRVHERETAHWFFVSGYVGVWRRLRERLTPGHEPGYPDARAAAAGLLAAAKHQVERCALAYAFPLESAWAAAEVGKVEQVHAPFSSILLPPAHLAPLFSSLDDAELVETMLRDQPELRHHL